MPGFKDCKRLCAKIQSLKKIICKFSTENIVFRISVRIFYLKRLNEYKYFNIKIKNIKIPCFEYEINVHLKFITHYI